MKIKVGLKEKIKRLPRRVKVGLFFVSLAFLTAGFYLFHEGIIKAREEINYWKISQALQLFKSQPMEGIAFKENEKENSYTLASLKEEVPNPYQVKFFEKTVSFQKGDSDIPLILNLVNPSQANKMEQKDNRVVYYFDNFAEAYTPTEDKLKNDILMLEPPEDGFYLSWQIDLQNGELEAKLEENGDVNIYGFSKISGKAGIQDELTQKALDALRKEKSEKTLLYTIPAPIVIEANQKTHKDLAFYGLDGNILNLKIKGDYKKLNYPISIDPTILYGQKFVFNKAKVEYVSSAALDDNHSIVAFSDYSQNGSGKAKLVSCWKSDMFNSYMKSEQVFNAAKTTYISVTALDSTHALIAYKDEGDSGHGTAIIAAAGTSTLTFGPEYIFNSSTSDDISAIALDSSRVLISYGEAGKGYSVVASISGSVISFGPKLNFNNTAASQITGTKIDTDKVLIAYKGASNFGKAQVCEVSGTSVACGTALDFNNSSDYISAANIGVNRAAIFYRDTGNSNYGTARTANVSGYDISFGAEYVFNSAAISYTSAAVLDSTHLFIVYQDVGSSGFGTALIASVSGDVLSFGTKNVFQNSAISFIASAPVMQDTKVLVFYAEVFSDGAITGGGKLISLSRSENEYTFSETDPGTLASSAVALDSTHVFIAYSRRSDLYGFARIATISGSTVTFGPEYPFQAGCCVSWPAVAKLDTDKVVIGWNNARSIVGKISGTTISFGTASNYFGANGRVSSPSLAALDSSHFLFSYQEDNKKGAARIATVSGTSTVIFGPEYAYNPTSTQFLSAAPFDSTHALIIYGDVANSNLGTAVLATFSGTSTINYSAELPFTVNPAWRFSATKIDNTHVLVAYTRDGSSYLGYGMSKIFTLSGSNISYGPEYEFSDEPYFGISATTLDPTHVLIAYVNNGDNLQTYTKVGTLNLSDSSISFGNGLALNPSSENDWRTNFICASVLDSSKALVIYQDYGDPSGLNPGKAVVADTNYLAILPDSAAGSPFKLGLTSMASVSALGPDKVFIAYNDGQDWSGEVNYGNAVIGMISGPSFSFSDVEYSFNPTSTTNIVTKALDSSHILLVYKSEGKGKAVVATVSGTSISYGSEYVFNSSADVAYISVALLSPTKAFIAYQDVADGEDGKAVVADISGLTISFGSEYTFCVSSQDTDPISVTVLDSSRVLITYGDRYQHYSSGYFRQKVASVSGSAISFGAQYGTEYLSNPPSLPTMFLDSAHVLVLDKNYSDAIGKIAIISGASTVSMASSSVYASSTQYIDSIVTPLSSTRGLIFYESSATPSNGLTVDFSGTSTIAYGQKFLFNDSTTELMSIDSLNPYKAVLVFTSGGKGIIRTVDIGESPIAPSLVAPSDGAAGVSLTPTLQFTCNASFSCTKFDLQLDDNSDFSSVIISKTDYSNGGPWATSSAISYQVSSGLLDINKTYYWKARVFDGVEWSPWSNGTWHFTTTQPPSVTSIFINTSNPNICKIEGSTTVCKSGQNITFNSTASDPDGGLTKLFVCKNPTCDNCGFNSTSSCWAYSVIGAAGNPSATYDSASAPACGSGQTTCRYCANSEYWAKVCNSSVCSNVIGK